MGEMTISRSNTLFLLWLTLFTTALPGCTDEVSEARPADAMMDGTVSDAAPEPVPDAAPLPVDAEPLVLEPPPADEGIYGFAHGCYTLEAFDGYRTLRHLTATADGEGYAFTDGGLDGAARFHMRASDLGIYLFYDTERRYLLASQNEETEAWQFKAPTTLESAIDRLEDGFLSPAEWHLQASTRAPGRYQLQHYATDMFLTLEGLTANVDDAAIITLQPREGCVAFPELTIDATGTVEARQWEDGDVYGIAEIHSHMMAGTGFGGGGLYHGHAFHRLGVERALPDCDRSHGEDGRRDIIGYFSDSNSSFDIDLLLPLVLNGELSDFNHNTDGYPKFTEWPNSWRRSSHHVMYYRWVERAYLAGLRLLVQDATGNAVICELTKAVGAQETLYDCNDMISVDRAIAQAHALERYVDAQSGGPGLGWFRVVDSPAKAREVINQGKLAVVLGIEISNLFDCFLTPPMGFEPCTADGVRTKLDHYQTLGVSVIFPVHKYDNGFSAGDGHNGIIELGNFINSGHYSNFVEDCPGPSTAFEARNVTFGGLNRPREAYDEPPPVDMSAFAEDPLATLLPFAGDLGEPGLEGAYCQKHGLTALGEVLVEELMDRGMLIDVAHLPQRSLGRTFEMLEANDYPALNTHGGNSDGRLYALGGLSGTGFPRCSNPNAPGNMIRRLTAAVEHRVSEGAYPAEALSFDLNGFAGGPRPRFGDNAGCGNDQINPITYPFTAYAGDITFEQPHLGDREVDFNTEGMIHIGLLPELLEDVRRDGATDAQLEPLFRSAEAYIRMWEQAEARAAE